MVTEVAMVVGADLEVVEEEASGVAASEDGGAGKGDMRMVFHETAFSDGVGVGLNTLVHDGMVVTDVKSGYDSFSFTWSAQLAP